VMIFAPCTTPIIFGIVLDVSAVQAVGAFLVFATLLMSTPVGADRVFYQIGLFAEAAAHATYIIMLAVPHGAASIAQASLMPLWLFDFWWFYR
jgi:hypothetical protein